MLSPRVLRTLEPLGAARGLVAAGASFYVIAGDGDALGAFPRQGSGAGRVRTGLPGGATMEEQATPPADLSALVALTGGGLLALGRDAAVHWPAPGLDVPARAVDLAALHTDLATRLPGLRVVGACLSGTQVVLALDGAGGAALAVCSPAALLEGGGTASVHALDGPGTTQDGSPLVLTDLAALPDGRLLATAVAPGASAGGAVVVLRPNGRVERVHPFAEPLRAEGLHAAPRGDGTVDLLLCAASAEPGAPPSLLGVSLRL